MLVAQYSPSCSTVGSSYITLAGGAASKLVEIRFDPTVKYLQ